MSRHPIVINGAPGSPYTRKVVAVLRYRRLPYQLLHFGIAGAPDLPKPKVQLLPTVYLPGPRGEMEALVDSTPIIRRLEAENDGRPVVPHEPVAAFLDYLIEDYADEWLTKAMFHYRWHYAADIAKAAALLPRWANPSAPEAQAVARSKWIAERQIGRLYVVGSNETTKPVIEASYLRFLDLFKAHLEVMPFLMGRRPGASDFAVYGQLTQLALFDPTPRQLTLERAPRVTAWAEVMEDLSGLAVEDEGWIRTDPLPPTLASLLTEIGRVYVPFLLANERAMATGSKRVEAEIDGRPWVQETFPYQAKCIQWLRNAYADLGARERAVAARILDGTGCERLFAPA